MNATDSVPPRKSVVLLGVGHTNAHIVKEWASAPVPHCQLICISKFPTATYSGMLPGTLGQQFRDDEMRIDLTALIDRVGAELVLADVSGLDLKAGEVQFSDRDPLPFDALSIGVGSMPVGWQDHAHSRLLVPVKPMQTFLQRLDSHLLDSESACQTPLRVSLVGGGVSSVEIALCLQQRWGKRDTDRAIEIEIFTSSDHVADGMRPRSVRRIEKMLHRRGIAVHTGHRVVEVTDLDLATAEGKRHPTHAVIWATGAAAPPVLESLGLQTDDRGFIATSNTLQSLTDDRIFAVGDSGTVIESPSPKAGVYAVRQCPILGHNLRAFLAGESMQTFQPQEGFLKLLNTGDGKAMLEYGWLTCHARWCWQLKTWIDQRFIREFKKNGES